MFFVSRKKGLLLTIIVIGTAFLILFAWSPWNSLRYHGDGKFSDRGFFSYPRYLVTFSDIQLSQTGEHHFHFRGLPNEEMTLALLVEDRRVDTWADTAPLANLPVTIEVVLTDDKGYVACRAYGRPAPSNVDGVWVLTWGGAAAYWHHQCNFVRVHPNRIYDLAIRVKDIGPSVEKVVVTPRLTAGGIELP
jgi:hypothetical protein